MVFLELFLQTVEKHFMVGHRVTCYVFTNQLAAGPRVPLPEGRRVVVLEVPGAPRWEDMSMQCIITPHFLCEVDYLVCTEVDMKFRDHVSMEILSPIFGTLHPSFYRAALKDFSYEHRPQSQVHIPRDQGDFYYMGTFFGGSVVEVHRLTLACHQEMGVDLASGIEVVWHDESHLNRHLLDHKPLKVLSPEDL
ncbi:histo-blood group ABO system transferase 2-like [Neomonachus schauinslandi]|uniref:Histo-blood group ABO system transferase 2-like n=1 Tax=Neomonachus schauinslandi TaxID=29088 RepID=A0A8M1MBK5_NEOSC|nr:histo-blood group ABO system transferase 2-like [Neomonachus schauinslandi]